MPSIDVPAGGRAPRFVVLGRQGSGKGLQAGRLALAARVPHVDTGATLRAAAGATGALGAELRRAMARGELVRDEVVVDAVLRRLGLPSGRHHGFVLDGFPRTVHQAATFVEALDGDGVDAALLLEVPPDVALERLRRRRVCEECGVVTAVDPAAPAPRCTACGGRLVRRDDDRVEAISRRLAIYDAESEPLIAWFRAHGSLAAVDGDGTPATVTERLLRAVDDVLERHAGHGRSLAG